MSMIDDPNKYDDFSEYSHQIRTFAPDYTRSLFEQLNVNKLLTKAAKYNLMNDPDLRGPGGYYSEIAEQDDIYQSTPFIIELLEHFRDSGMGTNLGLQRGSGIDPASYQSPEFLRLLTTPKVAYDVYLKDKKIKDKLRRGRGDIDIETLKKQQDALRKTSDALLNQDNYRKTGRFYDTAKRDEVLPPSKTDVDITDVIKALGIEPPEEEENTFWENLFNLVKK